MLLTAAHVVGYLNSDRESTNRVHTNDLAPTHLASKLVGHSVRSLPDALPDEDAQVECNVDAALIQHLDEFRPTRDVGDVTLTGDYYTDPLDATLYEREVIKSGAKSKTTKGVIIQIGAEFVAKRESWWVRYPLGYMVMSNEDGHCFAQPGDSGAVVADMNGKIVGLLVAMQPPSDDPSTLAFVIPIAPAIDDLNIRLIGPGWPHQ